MNTQTHLLLGAALLARSRVGDPAGPQPVVFRGHNRAVILGALLPDLSLYVMWLSATMAKVPERVIWSEWYYSDFWQQAGAVTNSIPIYLGLFLLAVIVSGGWRKLVIGSRPVWLLLAIFALAALTHTLSDFPLHHDDGRPHFWPLSAWIFASPVSYWDPDHYGHIWSVIEIVIGLLLVTVLWRRFVSVWIRSALVTTLMSYAAIGAYWAFTLGGG